MNEEYLWYALWVGWLREQLPTILSEVYSVTTATPLQAFLLCLSAILTVIPNFLKLTLSIISSLLNQVCP